MDRNNQDHQSWIHSLHPDVCVWEITLACNMRCLHCGSSASPLTKRPDELSTQEAINVVKQLKEIKTRKVVLSGGEPFLRKDWFIIAQAIAEMGMTPAFVSNGFLIDEEIAKKMKRINRPDLHIGLSIDGNERVHDYIRQTKGSFKKVTEALQILRDYGINVSVITQVNKLNFKQLPYIRDHIFKYGIYAWQIQLATPFGRMAENPKLLLTPREYLELVKFIVEHRRIMGNMVIGADDIGYYTELEPYLRPQKEWHGCQAGLRNIGITSNGGVTGCLSLQAPQYIEANLREKNLKDIWYDPDFASYNRNFKENDLKGYCRECPHRLKCRAGCKNTAISFTGSIYENYYCVFRIMLGKVPEEIRPSDIVHFGHYHP
ncbi:MAG TPA: radical SAM protein [Candidatus Omnitrophica bacterium]|nr:radical SAM protein [Candidatus Omnitrophota bacterium]